MFDIEAFVWIAAGACVIVAVGVLIATYLNWKEIKAVSEEIETITGKKQSVIDGLLSLTKHSDDHHSEKNTR